MLVLGAVISSVWLAPEFHENQVFLKAPPGTQVVCETDNKVVFKQTLPQDSCLRWNEAWLKGLSTGRHTLTYVLSWTDSSESIKVLFTVQETRSKKNSDKLLKMAGIYAGAGAAGGCCLGMVYGMQSYCPAEYGDDTLNLYECYQGCAGIGCGLGAGSGFLLYLLTYPGQNLPTDRPFYTMTQEVLQDEQSR